MNPSLKGIGVFIASYSQAANGNTGAIIAGLLSAKASYVCIEAFSGTSASSGVSITSDLVSQYKSNGIGLYVYGHHIGTNVQGEISLATSLLPLVDGYIMDIESDFTGGASGAQELAQGIQSARATLQSQTGVKKLIGFMGNGNYSANTSFPYGSILPYVDYFFPQILYNEQEGVAESSYIATCQQSWVIMASALDISLPSIVPAIPYFSYTFSDKSVYTVSGSDLTTAFGAFSSSPSVAVFYYEGLDGSAFSAIESGTAAFLPTSTYPPVIGASNSNFSVPPLPAPSTGATDEPAQLIIKYRGSDGQLHNLNPYFTNVQFKDVLDTYGTFLFDYPLADPKGDSIGKRSEIQFWENGQFVYGGYVTSRDTVASTDPNSTLNVEFSGVGYLDDFVNEITVPNIAYVNASVSDILNPQFAQTLIRPSNWLVNVESTDQTFTYLSSLQTSMETFNIITQQIGFHFRYDGNNDNQKVIDFGLFGDFNGVRIRQRPTTMTDSPDDLLFVDNNGLEMIEDSLNVCNYVYVIGGSSGSAQLTLRDTDPSIVDPLYPVLLDPQTANPGDEYDPTVYATPGTAPNTSYLYYLCDNDSIATYGVMKKAVTFSDVYTLPASQDGYTQADLVNGANELYKAARLYLLQNKDETVSFNFYAYGNAPSLRVGDVVDFKYYGEVKKITENGSTRVMIDVEDYYYVVDYTVLYTQNKKKSKKALKQYQITLSSIIKYKRPLAHSYNRRIRTVTLKNPKGAGANTLAALAKITSTSVKQKQTATVVHKHDVDGLVDSSNPIDFTFKTPTNIIYTSSMTLSLKVTEWRESVNGHVVKYADPPGNIHVSIDGVDYTAQLNALEGFTMSGYGDYPSLTGTFDLLKASAKLQTQTALISAGSHTIIVSIDSGNARIQGHIIQTVNAYK